MLSYLQIIFVETFLMRLALSCQFIMWPKPFCLISNTMVSEGDESYFQIHVHIWEIEQGKLVDINLAHKWFHQISGRSPWWCSHWQLEVNELHIFWTGYSPKTLPASLHPSAVQHTMFLKTLPMLTLWPAYTICLSACLSESLSHSPLFWLGLLSS